MPAEFPRKTQLQCLNDKAVPNFIIKGHKRLNEKHFCNFTENYMSAVFRSRFKKLVLEISKDEEITLVGFDFYISGLIHR